MPKFSLNKKSDKKPKKILESKKKKKILSIPSEITNDYSDDDDDNEIINESKKFKGLFNNNKDDTSDDEVKSNLDIESLQKEIIKEKYNKTINNISKIMKNLTCDSTNKKLINQLVYYYIEYFLYTCAFKEKDIFKWLKKFKNLIDIR